MTCDEAREAFSDLYDEALSGAPLVTLTQHLASCPACRAEWSSFRKAMQAVADLGSAEPSPGFAAGVHLRIQSPTRWQRVTQWLFLPLRVKVPIQAVALVLLAFAGLLLYQRSPELRRATDPSQTPSPPVASEAPTPVSPPTAAEEPTRQAEGPALRTDAPKTEQAKPEAPPTAAATPPPPAPAEAEKDRGVPSPREEAKEGQISSASPSAADQLYSGALADLGRESYNRAIDSLRDFIQQNPRDVRIPDARMRLGDAYVAQQRHKEAISEYEAVVRDFPNSPLIPAALYRQAQARLALGDQAGCQTLRDLTSRYPQASEAALAREALSTRCR